MDGIHAILNMVLIVPSLNRAMSSSPAMFSRVALAAMSTLVMKAMVSSTNSLAPSVGQGGTSGGCFKQDICVSAVPSVAPDKHEVEGVCLPVSTFCGMRGGVAIL